MRRKLERMKLVSLFTIHNLVRVSLAVSVSVVIVVTVRCTHILVERGEVADKLRHFELPVLASSLDSGRILRAKSI
jgi:hypothetical protein